LYSLCVGAPWVNVSLCSSFHTLPSWHDDGVIGSQQDILLDALPLDDVPVVD
jgi:hypothetical protein